MARFYTKMNTFVPFAMYFNPLPFSKGSKGELMAKGLFLVKRGSWCEGDNILYFPSKQR